MKKEIGYVFSDESLFELALTQSGANADKNNERLEFLGDRVLGLSVAEMLYKMFPNEKEGELARRHAALVSTKTLAEVARKFGFDKQIRHGHMTGGRMEHISANAMESIIAAIFLDGGWSAASSFVTSEWQQLAIEQIDAPKDAKTELQEFAQHSEDGKLPVYEFLDSKRGTFNVRVTVMGMSAMGSGTSKKSATISAAEKLLEKIKLK